MLISKNVVMLKEMLAMQKILDDRIIKKYNVEYTLEMNLTATMDELGELNHELKGGWCWWRKTQKPMDANLILGELVDVWHCVLARYNVFGGHAPLDNVFTDGFQGDNSSLIDFYRHLLDRDSVNYLVVVLELTHQLGFSFEDVYNGYMIKNKENHERQENGY